jgi:hypothetical protein
MPDDDLEELSRLISEAMLITETRGLASVGYLLELAAIELGKLAEMPPPKPPEMSKRPTPSARRRGPRKPS